MSIEAVIDDYFLTFNSIRQLISLIQLNSYLNQINIQQTHFRLATGDKTLLVYYYRVINDTCGDWVLMPEIRDKRVERYSRTVADSNPQ